MDSDCEGQTVLVERALLSLSPFDQVVPGECVGCAQCQEMRANVRLFNPENEGAVKTVCWEWRWWIVLLL